MHENFSLNIDAEKTGCFFISTRTKKTTAHKSKIILILLSNLAYG